MLASASATERTEAYCHRASVPVALLPSLSLARFPVLPPSPRESGGINEHLRWVHGSDLLCLGRVEEPCLSQSDGQPVGSEGCPWPRQKSVVTSCS